MSKWLCTTYLSGGNIAAGTVRTLAWHYLKDPGTLFLCETVFPKQQQQMLHNLSFPMCMECYIVFSYFPVGPLLQAWGKALRVNCARTVKELLLGLTCLSVSQLGKVCNELVGLKAQEGQSFCIFFPQNEFLFTLMSRCEQCRSCSSSIKIELKCS